MQGLQYIALYIAYSCPTASSKFILCSTFSVEQFGRRKNSLQYLWIPFASGQICSNRLLNSTCMGFSFVVIKNGIRRAGGGDAVHGGQDQGFPGLMVG
jgi:hypothetical protein